MSLLEFIQGMSGEQDLKIRPRAYFNHAVEFKKPYTAEERAKKLEEIGLNVFFFPSEMVTGCDCLSDSGTSTMTNQQWAALHYGDESYGCNKGYYLLKDQIHRVFGEEFFNTQELGRPNAFIFHQARSAENALFSQIGKLGQNLVITSNGYFDTTEANAEANKIKALNLFSPELKNENSNINFKGNMDTVRLEELLKNSSDKVPLIYMTITNNPGGGQPVSMANIKRVAEIAKKYEIPFFFDACRFAENAWFIKKHETGFESKTVLEIVREMFAYADGFTISFKKDGLVNMGGGLFLKDGGLFIKKYPQLPNCLVDFQILTEGNPSYGGMSGRDIMALVEGLKTITQEYYLDHRINQVQQLGQTMHEMGLPVLMPTGGHAVYLDVNKFFADIPMRPEDFGGISLTAILLAAYGHRACELGYFAFGQYDKDTGQEKLPEVNFVRFAIPRLRYERQDLDSMALAIKNLYDNRDNIPAVEVVYGRDLTLRHFKAKFKFK